MNENSSPRDDFDSIREGFKIDKKTDDFTINVRDRNREALQAIVSAYDITLPARTIMEWRACAPHRGTIQGFEHLGTLAILCTDGVVGWFLRLGVAQRPPQAHGEVRSEALCLSPLFYGHTQHFSGKVVCPFTNTQASSAPSEADEAKASRSKEKRASLALRVNVASKLLEALGLVGMTKTNL